MDIHKRAVRALLKRTAGTRGPDRITRHAMYTRLRETVPRPDGPARILSISGSTKLVERLDLATGEVVEADYPKHDLLHLKFADDSFDYLVADQVLEHGLRYQRVPKATWHPLHRAAIRNDPEWPIVTWIVARKW